MTKHTVTVGKTKDGHWTWIALNCGVFAGHGETEALAVQNLRDELALLMTDDLLNLKTELVGEDPQKMIFKLVPDEE